MKKIDYSIIREKLKKETGKYPRYFTRKFYSDFVSAYTERGKNNAAGINTEYRAEADPHVLRYREYIPVYNSAFYRNDGANYCLFLEIFYSMTA